MNALNGPGKPNTAAQQEGITAAELAELDAQENVQDYVAALSALGHEVTAFEGQADLPQRLPLFPLAGALLLLSVLTLVVVRGFSVASAAPDAFGRLLAATLTATVLVQGAVNVAVNLRLFPATGIPLPFVSVGGSSMITNLTAMGLLQAIHARGGRRR